MFKLVYWLLFNWYGIRALSWTASVLKLYIMPPLKSGFKWFSVNLKIVPQVVVPIELEPKHVLERFHCRSPAFTSPWRHLLVTTERLWRYSYQHVLCFELGWTEAWSYCVEDVWRPGWSNMLFVLLWLNKCPPQNVKQTLCIDLAFKSSLKHRRF